MSFAFHVHIRILNFSYLIVPSLAETHRREEANLQLVLIKARIEPLCAFGEGSHPIQTMCATHLYATPRSNGIPCLKSWFGFSMHRVFPKGSKAIIWLWGIHHESMSSLVNSYSGCAYCNAWRANSSFAGPGWQVADCDAMQCNVMDRLALVDLSGVLDSRIHILYVRTTMWMHSQLRRMAGGQLQCNATQYQCKASQ